MGKEVKHPHDTSDELSRIIKEFNEYLRNDTRFKTQGGLWTQPVVIDWMDTFRNKKKRKEKLKLP